MKSKGFTLVELLAVLVLISAVVLIAVPSILNYINESKDEISDVTEKIITSGAELYVEANKKNFIVPQKQYCVTLQEIVDQKHLSAPILDSVTGNEVDLDTFVKIDHYYNLETERYDYRYTVSSECVEREYLCAAVTKDSVSIGNVPIGDYNAGDEYICQVSNNEFYRFFVLKKDGDSIKLLLDRNLGGTVAWAESGSNSEGPVTANAALADRTSGWTKISQEQIMLPSRDDLGPVEGQDWIRINLDENNDSQGYWTLTPSSSSDGTASYVDSGGSLDTDLVVYDDSYGIRPIITFDISKIKN